MYGLTRRQIKRFIGMTLPAILLFPALGYGKVVFSNSAPAPEDQIGGSCFAGQDRVAVGFSVPSGSDYLLDSVKVYLNVNSDGDGIPFSVYLHGDDDGLPGERLSLVGEDVGSYNGPDSYQYFTLEPNQEIKLLSDSGYWIAIENSSTVQPYCAYGWNWGDTPHSGIFQPIGEARQDGGGPWFPIGGQHVIEVEGSKVSSGGDNRSEHAAFVFKGDVCIAQLDIDDEPGFEQLMYGNKLHYNSSYAGSGDKTIPGRGKFTCQGDNGPVLERAMSFRAPCMVAQSITERGLLVVTPDGKWTLQCMFP